MMEHYYLILVGILFIFAISDLIVGVSNDAVNFLNSAIGSKAAPFWFIMIIASLGVLFGATFSSGMMEVARKGIFVPQQYYFNEIMIIFVAVMITDVLLLDTFNTLGLPTSTTVSIVFELLGGAVAVALIKMSNLGESFDNLNNYINTDTALKIITGILLSVIIAFTVGAVVQYLTRLLFSFKVDKTLKLYGSVFGGLVVTAITYFILIKGAKSASFMTDDLKNLIKENSLLIVGISFVLWTILLQLLNWIFNFNILKFSVLAGTFALAMAFAGNDLVNFIGVPLAGFESYNAYVVSGDVNMPMTALAEKVQTPTLYLLIAGMIMVMTLWLSKKARSVTATTLNLSSQSQGSEQFGSSLFARSIVRGAINLSAVIEKVLPEKVMNWLHSRFQIPEEKIGKKDSSSFDMIRASVNLLVAGVLISIATSFKLPLSTTYVTFMVAMGTSLADGAWGRESAVYRITGVITVIGGWFFTAFVAFTICAIVAYLIDLGGAVAIVILLLLVVFVVYRSKKAYAKKENEKSRALDEIGNTEAGTFTERCAQNITKTFTGISEIYDRIIEGLSTENRRLLRGTLKDTEDLNSIIKVLKDNLNFSIKEMSDSSLENGHNYVQAVDYLRESAHCMTYIAQPTYEYFNNNHKEFSTIQKEELITLNKEFSKYLEALNKLISDNDFDKLEEVIAQQAELLTMVNKMRKKQIKRIKKDVSKTRNSMLYLGIIHETKSLILHALNIAKSQRDFVMINFSE